MFKKLNKKGFTLAELLVVVAIIGVLVAISIPIFTSQLEKAREATDAANLRSAYAVAAANKLTDEGTLSTSSTKVTITQATAGWKFVDEIAGVNPDDDTNLKTVTKGDTVDVGITDAGVPTFTVTKKS